MSKDQQEGYKQGYQAAEKFYQTQIDTLKADVKHLNRSKGAARSHIKKLKAQIGERV